MSTHETGASKDESAGGLKDEQPSETLVTIADTGVLGIDISAAWRPAPTTVEVLLAALLAASLGDR